MLGITTVKPHIKFRKCGEISLTGRVSALLGIEAGDAIDIVEDKGEMYIYVSCRKCRVEDGLRGVTRKASTSKGFLRAQWKELSMYIINKDGRAQEAYYRVGEPLEINGTLYLPIITRRNYAAKDQL